MAGKLITIVMCFNKKENSTDNLTFRLMFLSIVMLAVTIVASNYTLAAEIEIPHTVKVP